MQQCGPQLFLKGSKFLFQIVTFLDLAPLVEANPGGCYYYKPRTAKCIEKKSKIISNQFYFTFVHIVKCKLHKLAHALTPYRSPSPQILRMVTSLCRRKSPQRILPPMLLSTGAATISLPLPPINRETICSRRTTPPTILPNRKRRMRTRLVSGRIEDFLRP